MADLDGKLRKADELYDLLADGDRIGVGLSGGKDSTALLWALAKLRGYCGKQFELVGLTIDPQFGGKEGDFSALTAFCNSIGVQHVIKRDNLYEVVFETRKEKNPCALCARMRRGSLHKLAKELCCNKVALGHHMDDAAATFWLNLLHEGRIGSFSPKTYLDRSDITVIRPMVLCRESEIIAAANKLGIPVIKSGCPVDGSTERQRMHDLMRQLQHICPDLEERTFAAMQRSAVSGYGTNRKENTL